MPRIAPFPHQYPVTLADGRLAAPPRPPIPVGPPPQFGGEDDTRWSPEELLVGAVAACLWTTFEAFARRDGLTVAAWSARATGVLDRAPRVPAFTELRLAVELTVAPGDEDRARRVLHAAEAHCLVSAALRAPVRLEVTVHAG